MIIYYLFLMSIFIVVDVQGQQKALSAQQEGVSLHNLKREALENLRRAEASLAQQERVCLYNLERAALESLNRAEDYYSGTATVAQDYEQARNFFELVASQDDNREAQAWAWFRLGDIYCLGHGGLRDYEEAFRYFKLAADQPSNLEAVACASFRLGEIYYFGAGVAKNNEKAEEYFEEAEEHAAEDLADRADIRQAVALYFDAIYRPVVAPESESESEPEDA